MKTRALSTKLYLGFGTLTVLLCLLSIGTLQLLQRLAIAQAEGARRAADSAKALRAAAIGDETYSLIADAIINRNLAETERAWSDLDRESLEHLEDLAHLVDTPQEQGLLKEARKAYATMVSTFEDELRPTLEQGAEMTQVRALDARIDSAKFEFGELMHSIAESLQEESAQANAQFLANKTTLNRTAIGISVVGVVLSIAVAVLIARSVHRTINRVVSGLGAGSKQIAVASRQISSTSQTLAQGASEQAASVEECSSSLEEMNSVARENADRANTADQLTQQTIAQIQRVQESVGSLSSSMSEISRASEETSMIIKTIDEIAFQTNLLALNAAVEAARAGEAGAGFAVVADEVRNLAIRAAKAARNTATLIEGTVSKVHQGSKLVESTATDFSEITTATGKIGEIVSHIASASSEQARGVEQINIAVNQIDKVTQSNAAHAEENASASEELTAQSAQILDFVRELECLAGHDGSAAAASAPSHRGRSIPSGRKTPAWEEALR